MNSCLRQGLTSCLCFLFLALWTVVSKAADATNETNRIISVDEVSMLLRTADLHVCQRLIEQWEKSLPFQKLALAEELVSLLQDRESCPVVRDSQSKDGGNDKSLVAGRAQWALEQIMNVQLEEVTLSTKTNDLVALRSKSEALVEACRKEIMSKGGEHLPPAFVERYKGKIIPGVSTNALQSAVVMQEFLAKWSPLGKPIEDLAVIIGSDGEKVEDGVSYKFDTGDDGFDFRFVVKQRLITSVKVLGID